MSNNKAKQIRPEKLPLSWNYIKKKRWVYLKKSKDLLLEKNILLLFPCLWVADVFFVKRVKWKKRNMINGQNYFTYQCEGIFARWESNWLIALHKHYLETCFPLLTTSYWLPLIISLSVFSNLNGNFSIYMTANTNMSCHVAQHRHCITEKPSHC